MLKSQAAHGSTSLWFDKFTMRSMPLRSLTLILSLSKDEAWICAFFSQAQEAAA